MNKVLVVEDNSQLAEMYRLKFAAQKFNIAVAHNGVEGLAACEKFKPDLILLDLMMPEMTGEEMLKKLRKTDWGAKIRVIILTNISKDEAPASLRLLNVDRYIVKAHYTPAEVAKVVQEVLGEEPLNKAK